MTVVAFDPAKHPRHPAGSSQGGEFARKDGGLRQVEGGEVKRFPAGIFEPEGSVKFWPKEQGARMTGPAWKAWVDPTTGEELAFWFVGPMGAPHHLDMANELGIAPPKQDEVLVGPLRVSGYGNEPDMQWMTSYFAQDLGVDREEIKRLSNTGNRLHEMIMESVNEVVRRHRKDIRDADEMTQMPIAASALNWEADALVEAEQRLRRQYEKVYRRAARRAAADYRRLTTITAAGQPQPQEVVEAKQLLESFLALTGVARRDLLKQVLEALGVLEGDERAALREYLGLLEQQIGVQAARLQAGAQDAAADVLLDATAEGWSVPQTAQALQQKLESVAPWQATMLARTDLIALGNGASLQRAVTLDDPELQFKTWLATPDERTRVDHRHAHGQTQPITQPFTVGGEQLLYPGDPSASDGNVINCRCTILYSDSPFGPPGVKQIVMQDDLAVSAAGWDESKHPREPSGSEKGGQFAPALVAYTANSFGLNDALRNDRPLGGHHWLEMAKELDALIDEKGEDSTDDMMTVYRGVPRKWPHQHYTELGYLSTTEDPDEAEYFAGEDGEVLEIRVPEGQRFYRVPAGAYDAGYDQKEIIFPRGTDLRRERDGTYSVVTHWFKPPLRAAGWDESDHPRHPKGNERGGQFRGAALLKEIDRQRAERAAKLGRVAPEYDPHLKGMWSADADEYIFDPDDPFYANPVWKAIRFKDGSWKFWITNHLGFPHHEAVLRRLGKPTMEGALYSGDSLRTAREGGFPDDPEVTLNPELQEVVNRHAGKWRAAQERASRAFAAAAWDESAHPRHPAGSPEGGQFAPYYGAMMARGSDGKFVGYQAFRMERGKRKDKFVKERGKRTLVGPVRDTYQEAAEDARRSEAEERGEEYKPLYPTVRIPAAPPFESSRAWRKPVAAAAWDPADHPRHPAGSPEGGEFAPAENAAGATVDWDEAEREFQAWAARLAPYYADYPEGYWDTAQAEFWGSYQDWVNRELPALQARLNGAQVPGLTIQPQLNPTDDGDMDVVLDPERAALSGPDFQVELPGAEDGLAPGFTVWTYPVGVNAQHADDPDWFEQPEGVQVEDVLDITDTDFFPDGPDSDLAGDYARAVDAARGVPDEPGYVTIYRGMTDSEFDEWDTGAEIPMGKFFAGIPTTQYAQDVSGHPPNLYSFRIPRHMLMQTGPYEYQLKKRARLKDGVLEPSQTELVQAHSLPPHWQAVVDAISAAAMTEVGADEAVTAAAVKYTGGGGMICLYPESEEAAEIAREGGQPADDLHVTLLFYEDGVPGDAEAVIRELGFDGLQGEITGIGRFEAGEDGVPVVGLVSAVGLNELRAELAERLPGYSTRHGFVPHLTLGYGNVKDAEGAVGLPVTFRAVSVKNRDEEREDITAAAWDPTEHPRHPAGSERGGEFAPKEGGQVASFAMGLQQDGTWKVSVAPKLRDYIRATVPIASWLVPQDILASWPNLDSEQAARLRRWLEDEGVKRNMRGQTAVLRQRREVLRDLAHQSPAAPVDTTAPTTGPMQPGEVRSILDKLSLGGGKNAATYLETAQLIDGTMYFPKVPGEPTLDVKGTGGRSREGAFWRQRGSLKPTGITLSANATNPMSSLTHEYGHYLDSLLGQDEWSGATVDTATAVQKADLDAAYERARVHMRLDPVTGMDSFEINQKRAELDLKGAPGPRLMWNDYSSKQATGTLAPVLGALKETEMYKTLAHAADSPRGYTSSHFTYGGRSFSPGKSHVRYLMEPPEMIARSYEQYIAAKNPGSKLATSTRHAFSDGRLMPPQYPGYMVGEDLARVNAVWERVLDERGLLKKKGLEPRGDERTRILRFVEESDARGDAAMAARAKAAAKVHGVGSFEEHEHPRYPKGHPKGGQFMPKPGSD